MKTIQKVILFSTISSLFLVSCKQIKSEQSKEVKKEISLTLNNDSIVLLNNDIKQSEWLEIEKKEEEYNFPCSEWNRKIIINDDKISLDLMEPAQYEISKIEKVNYGYNIYIKNAEWFYRFKWIDESKGISKWEYIFKNKVDESFSYLTVRNIQENVALIPKIDCNDIKKSLSKFNLDGNWAYDKESSYASIKIENDKGIFVVMSNQIYINIRIVVDDLDKNFYNVFYDNTNDLGAGGIRMSWDDYSKDKPIATIKKIVNNYNIEFLWIGFYNKKTKVVEFEKCEFNLQSNTNPVILQKV
jgi:hypothetical protein